MRQIERRIRVATRLRHQLLRAGVPPRHSGANLELSPLERHYLTLRPVPSGRPSLSRSPRRPRRRRGSGDDGLLQLRRQTVPAFRGWFASSASRVRSVFASRNASTLLSPWALETGSRSPGRPLHDSFTPIVPSCARAPWLRFTGRIETRCFVAVAERGLRTSATKHKGPEGAQPALELFG